MSVPSGVRLQDLAKVTGADYQALKRWNFDLVKGVTGAAKTGSTVDIYVPKSELVSSREERKSGGA